MAEPAALNRLVQVRILVPQPQLSGMCKTAHPAFLFHKNVPPMVLYNL